jgi:PadR family transcriptional regulator PadR
MGHPKLTEKEATVLGLLVRNGERYGLELVRESEGVLKRGTVYVLLERMTEKGYVDSRREENPTLSGMPRRKYKPTGLGEKALQLYELVELKAAEVFA